MIISGIYNYRYCQNQIVDFDGYHFQKKNIDYYILCNKLVNLSEKILQLYEQHGVNCTRYIDDWFLFVEATKNSLNIFPDVSNSLLPLYYTEYEDKFYYSTSLKKLLVISKIHRHIDLYSSRIFLQKGFLIDGRRLYLKEYIK